MEKIIKQYAAYNEWANDKIVAFIDQSDIDLKAPFKSSFETIFDNILHIWDAEYIWYKRVQGQPIETWPSKSFKGSWPELKQEFSNSNANWTNLMESMSTSDLEKEYSYKNSRDIKFTSSLIEIAMHLFNHATYHRGQIVTILHQNGNPSVGSTDLISFFRIQ
ncbi:MAG: putative damage-inducible protein DinB [Sphingobacteriales bacterium]|jgi:uncharacterized damage-inducible protein DinB